MSLVDSALKSARKLVDGMGNGGVAAVHSSNKLFGDGFELTNLGWAIRGVDPVNLCSWEEVNHVGDGKPNELGFVRDFSYKYKINAVHYYGYPSKLQETQFFVDDLGPLKTKLREYKREDMKDKMTVSEAMEILKESGKKAINESWRGDFEEDGLARFHLYLKLYDEDGTCVEDQEYGDPYTYGHDPIDETEIESWIGKIKRKWLRGSLLFSQEHDPKRDKLVIKGDPVIGSEDYFIAKSYDWTTKDGSECKAWEDVWF